MEFEGGYLFVQLSEVSQGEILLPQKLNHESGLLICFLHVLSEEVSSRGQGQFAEMDQKGSDD